MPTPFVAPLFALNSTGNSSVTINLGFRRPFLAWTTVTMVDPLIDYDFDNAVAADIFLIDGVVQPTRVFGGRHWGPFGSGNNVMPGARAGFGQRITFFLRVFLPAGSTDVEAFGEAIVLTLD